MKKPRYECRLKNYLHNKKRSSGSSYFLNSQTVQIMRRKLSKFPRNCCYVTTENFTQEKIPCAILCVRFRYVYLTVNCGICGKKRKHEKDLPVELDY